ncbi:hypothetical protein [Prevotella melaninogenica]|uniref:hypothetical protein n=1 Tax=Prevotella melaninogenica TaxID=28132 RepID=UPI002011F3D4|nr:hypothetical protein [Prevotella melaninogenica]
MEIYVRRSNSEGLKQAYPNSEGRIRHIFKHQVYGLAPTECIYRIALRYILGFDEDIHISEADHHLRQADSLPAAKAGTLEEFLDEVFKAQLVLIGINSHQLTFEVAVTAVRL